MIRVMCVFFYSINRSISQSVPCSLVFPLMPWPPSNAAFSLESSSG